MKCAPKTAIMVIMLLAAALMTSGCVSTGTYQAKEQESLQLSRSLEETKSAYNELQEKNRKLIEEGEALNQKINKLDVKNADLKLEGENLKVDNDKYKADIEKIRQENEKLKLDNEKFAIAVKPENILKTLTESFSALQAENAKLKQILASTEKITPKKDPEPPVKVDPVVAKPAAKAEESAPQTKAVPEVPREIAEPPKVEPAKKSEQKEEDAPLQFPADDKLPKDPPAELIK